MQNSTSLASETVQSTALALECVDDVHGGDRLALGMLGVGDGIADDVLEENLEDAASLFVDQARDTLDTATASQTTDCRLGYALDVVTEHLAMALGASFAESFSTFTTSRHSDY